MDLNYNAYLTKENGFDLSGDFSYESYFLTPAEYRVTSLYDQPNIKKLFTELRVNIIDLNPALITKCIQGTEQDFKMLVTKAKEYLEGCSDNDGLNSIIMELFIDCVFGYYILTPLIKAEDVSDIKIQSWNHITCKSNGNRYVTNLSFASEDDCTRWISRFLRISKLTDNEENALNHCSDIKGSSDFFLRNDVQLKYITSSGKYNLHIRKIPKEKYSWEYLINAGMLTYRMLDYIKDRTIAGYGFLISGKGGSGKSSLLNNMIDLIPYDQSGLVVQESDELHSEHPHFQFEHTLDVWRNGKNITYSLEDLLRLGLLQDIDNFVIGEIKGGEALYVFTTALSTGARFYGTIHSNNAVTSTRRLAQCARYISDYSVEALEEMLTATPICLIHMSQFSIDEIYEIEGWNTDKQHLEFRKVYRKYDNFASINGTNVNMNIQQYVV